MLLALEFKIALHNRGEGIQLIKDTPGLTILGQVNDLNGQISKCDLVILPYDREDRRKRPSGIL